MRMAVGFPATAFHKRQIRAGDAGYPSSRREEKQMTRAREIMTPDPTCVRESQTVREAAQLMADKGVGAVPICGEDNRLKGMLTDRDIVVKVLAEGKDPRAVNA